MIISFTGWTDAEVRSFFNECALEVESGTEPISTYRCAMAEMDKRKLVW